MTRRRHAASGALRNAIGQPARSDRTEASIDHAPAKRRVEAIDALRGIAIVAMIAYHFAFDLRLFGITRSDFENDPFWLAARAAIVSAFLVLVGFGLVLAQRGGIAPAARWKRIGVIAACALAASLGSYLVFPRTFIYFGVLHCIAVASVFAWPLVSRPRTALAVGSGIIAAGVLLRHPVFDVRALSWIGFNTIKPPTEDFVPLFPWLGIVLLGIAGGHQLVARSFAPLAPLRHAPRALRWLGRHSLAVYMVHQPVLIGALGLVFGR